MNIPGKIVCKFGDFRIEGICTDEEVKGVEEVEEIVIDWSNPRPWLFFHRHHQIKSGKITVVFEYDKMPQVSINDGPAWKANMLTPKIDGGFSG